MLIPSKMNFVDYGAGGAPSVLRVVSGPVPAAGAGEVLVKEPLPVILLLVACRMNVVYSVQELFSPIRESIPIARVIGANLTHEEFQQGAGDRSVAGRP